MQSLCNFELHTFVSELLHSKDPATEWKKLLEALLRSEQVQCLEDFVDEFLPQPTSAAQLAHAMRAAFEQRAVVVPALEALAALLFDGSSFMQQRPGHSRSIIVMYTFERRCAL